MNWVSLEDHLETVKQLYENRFKGCIEKAMDNAAKNGHPDVVKCALDGELYGRSDERGIGERPSVRSKMVPQNRSSARRWNRAISSQA